MNLRTSSPRPSPPFRMEERWPQAGRGGASGSGVQSAKFHLGEISPPALSRWTGERQGEGVFLFPIEQSNVRNPIH